MANRTDDMLRVAEENSRFPRAYCRPDLKPYKPKGGVARVFDWLADCWVGLLAVLIIVGFLGGVIWALVNSESDVQKRSEFITACQQNGFASNQCGFLYAMAKDADDAADESAALAGAAIGIAVGTNASSGGRR